MTAEAQSNALEIVPWNRIFPVFFFKWKNLQFLHIQSTNVRIELWKNNWTLDISVRFFGFSSKNRFHTKPMLNCSECYARGGHERWVRWIDSMCSLCSKLENDNEFATIFVVKCQIWDRIQIDTALIFSLKSPNNHVGKLLKKRRQTTLTWTEVSEAQMTSCDRGLMKDGRLADCFPCLNIRDMRFVLVSSAP